MEVVVAGPSELGDYIGLWHAVWPQRPRVHDEMLRDLTELPFAYRPALWLAVEGETLLGYAEASRMPGTKAAWSVEVGVIAGQRGRGIGDALHRAVDDYLRGERVNERFARVSEVDPESLAFAERRGYDERKRDFESQLDPQTVPDELLDAWCAPIPEVEIVPMAGLDSREFRQRLLALFETLREDVPRATIPEPIGFEFFDQHVVGDPDFRWHGSFLAMNRGRMIGMTANFEGDGPEFVDQWITGVLREWRRQGIARCLKAHSVRWSKANGVRTIRTDNDSQNAGMLAINDELGFVRKVGLVTMGRSEVA
ncbi:GNAT family N-acetyltransferase [bacterium]|nr:MAG: GNAT family N-acetyltransferase [bacterium]